MMVARITRMTTVNDNLPKEDLFKGDYCEGAVAGDSKCFISSDRRRLYIGDEPSMNVDEARQFRDWLNKVLP